MDTAAPLSLSEEQRQFVRRAFGDAVAREPTATAPRHDVEAAIARLYSAVGLRCPLFFYADNPIELMQMAFLLQSLASIPHGGRRRQLLRSRVLMPPPDLAWQLSGSLTGPWQVSLFKLMAQLNPGRLDRLSDDSHHDSTQTSYYCQPDLLKTCGSRLGFPAAPALATLYEEVVRDCLGCVWQRYSTTVARELVSLSQEHTAQPIWRQRAGLEMAIIDGDQLSLPAFVRDFARKLHRSPLPTQVREELFSTLDKELLFQLVLLQDTRCYHERVDGTSALKPAAHVHQQAQNIQLRLLESCANEIYMINWGGWLHDEVCLWRAVQSLFGSTLYSDRLAAQLNDFWTLRSNAFVYIFGSRAVFACANPVRLHWGSNDQLHSWEEPAVEFPDRTNWRFWRGIYISSETYDRTRELTMAAIEQERNVELRRVLIDRFGAARYLQESGARMISSDQYGVLWRKWLPSDEPLVMVCVRNSTPEPDGSYKEYFLRVPPQMQTAHEAVAWTFGMEEEEYQPEQQS